MNRKLVISTAVIMVCFSKADFSLIEGPSLKLGRMAYASDCEAFDENCEPPKDDESIDPNDGSGGGGDDNGTNDGPSLEPNGNPGDPDNPIEPPESEGSQRTRQQCIAPLNTSHSDCETIAYRNHTANLRECSSTSFTVVGGAEVQLGVEVGIPIVKFLQGDGSFTGTVEVSATVNNLPLCIAIADSIKGGDKSQCNTLRNRAIERCPAE